jgi:lysophospholipase L1-like esterase
MKRHTLGGRHTAWLGCWLCFGVQLLAAAAYAAVPGPPPHGRVLFLGDSITYAGEYVEFVEAGLRLLDPAAEFEFLDLGLPSETVSGLSEPGHADGAFPRPDLHERLERVLIKTKPDVVIACYGMNDGIYYPFSEDRFQKFQDGIRWLHQRVAQDSARIVHVTPPVFDPVPIKDHTLPSGQSEYRQPFEGYNQVLDRYSEWLLGQRAQGWEIVDIHAPINQFLTDKRQRDPAFTLARDGVHPDTTGHWLIARTLLGYFGAPEEIGSLESAQPMLDRFSQGPELLKLVQQRQRLLKDAWLTDTGHQRPGMAKGLPLAEAQTQAATLGEKIRALCQPLATPEIVRDAAGQVTLTCKSSPGIIRYTLDGSEPRRDAGAYLAPIDFPWEGTVRARLFANGDWAHGPVASASFNSLPGQTNARPHSALLPVTQNRDWRTYDWPTRHQAVCEAVRARKPDLVFIGDSITHFFGGEPKSPISRAPDVWEKCYGKRNALNLGFGWDRTENVLWRLQHGELDGASPKVVVVLIGTNNLEVNSPEEIVEAIHAICGELHTRLPSTQILLLALLPRSPKPDGLRAKLAPVNKGLAKLYFDDRPPGDHLDGVTFIGVGARFVDLEGGISPDLMNDYLHPTAKGYALMAEAIEPTLAAMLGESPRGQTLELKR